MKLSKEKALKKIEELKKYVKNEEKKENSSKVKLQIKTLAGEVLFESEKTTIKEAVVEAVEKDTDLRNADLRGTNLEDANLKDANLEGANLKDANLKDVDLRGANLKNANLKGANLEGANLEDIDLRGTNLKNADFYQTKFYGKGGTTKIKKSQVDDFFETLGVIVEED